MNESGIIGVGLVGTALAERLLAAGYRVSGYDIRPEQMEVLRRLGGHPHCSAAEAAASCERLILSLPSSRVTRSVLDQIEDRLAPGTIVIDTTTGDPADAADFARRLRDRGIEYLDATVGGSSRQVRDKEAIFICGGSKAAFDQCAGLLAHCCREAIHVGPASAGASMKLVLNLVLGLNRAVLAEGLEFARAAGIDPVLALEVLKAGPAYSSAMDSKGARMLSGDFEPDARLSQHLKDVRLILATGERAGAVMPLSSLHRTLLEEAEAAGYGGSDNSAIVTCFRKDRRP